jgi:bifunctional DNA-binding transcriptional regulator/antitoxin component of YhaV-PrlF toxin-antitoxin module
LSEKTELSVGTKGEIYTTKSIREKTGLHPGEKAIAHVEEGRLIIEPKPTSLSLLRKKRTADPVTPEEMRQHRRELSERLKER